MSTRAPHQTDLTRSARRAQGKALCQRVPHRSHGKWQPAPDRPDPLALLLAQDNGRLQHLLPIKTRKPVRFERRSTTL